MNFVPIRFSDPDFDPAYTAGFQLLIVINPESFSFAVRHPSSMRLVYVSTGNPIAQLFDPQSNQSILTAVYQKTIVALETNSFCMVPNTVFDDENMADFATFLSIKEADLVLKDEIENGENTIIFTFSGELVRKLEERFKTTDFKFAPKGWIKTVFQQLSPDGQLYLFLAENQLRVLFPKQGDIGFYNQFSFSNIEEIIYYTVLVVNQLKLKPNEIQVLVSGFIDPGSESMLRLRQFFKYVDVLDLNNGFRPKSGLEYYQAADFLGLY